MHKLKVHEVSKVGLMKLMMEFFKFLKMPWLFSRRDIKESLGFSKIKSDWPKFKNC